MGIKQILNNTTHGSTYLAKELLELILREKPTDETLTRYQEMINEEIQEMIILPNLMEKIMNANDPLKKAEELNKRISNTPKIISKKLEPKLPSDPTILTYSHSQTVVETLNHLNVKKIYCMISQPGEEGKKMAKDVQGQLVEDKIAINQLSLLEVDSIFIGVDQYTPNGEFVNKISTERLIKASKNEEIPVYALTSILKQINKLPKSVNHELLASVQNYECVKIITD